MRAKPRGAKYRNLNHHGGVSYYDRTVNGGRICFSTRTSDWDEAAAVDLDDVFARLGGN